MAKRNEEDNGEEVNYQDLLVILQSLKDQTIHAPNGGYIRIRTTKNVTETVPTQEVSWRVDELSDEVSIKREVYE